MKKIFTGGQIAELDRFTIKNEPIPEIELVERAARSFVYEFNRHYMPRRNDVYVFAGMGNNGADALAVSRMLLEDSYTVYTFLFNTQGKLTPECEENRMRLLETHGCHLDEVINEFNPPEMRAGSIIIDGLFGTGLNRPLEGGFAGLVQFINESGMEVVSIDIPSGLFSEENLGNNPKAIVHATRTFTFEYPKLAFLMSENAPFVGKWQEVSIGLSDEGKAAINASFFLATDLDMARALEPRKTFSHKYNFGHALLVAGSRGKMGAACLSAKAALRSGLGMLTAHVPACGEVIMQISVPEAMVQIDKDESSISGVTDPQKYSAVGVGPGLGKSSLSRTMLRELLCSVTKPIVLDADALNIIGEDRNLLDILPPGSILTPHARELERLTTFCDNDYDRLCQARALAANHNIYVVLKGAYSATCMPSGNVVFNTTGNPGMASGGSGDVLLGIITGLLAQGYPSATAAVLGNYLHGLAGDIYAGQCSQQSLIAGDIVECIGKAYKQLTAN
ncbi:NAD(P)H-hydrate dehydratase [Porphyromonas pogonae]|uniref:NAD(P)H-hydrate dehydratase n=1 Tax=Porphyromonas pogonae TaxID=867595 RepID=UPI002E79B7E6|nr:NAD(P)H-hydrate dehydratase [Porphyromonas pogonae]